MLDRLSHVIAKPLIGVWLTASPHSWERHVVATDSPHIHAPGTNPDRVLLVGDGAATGRGVRTHDLGLPGYLARSLTARTGRATDVDIIVDDQMTVGSGKLALTTTNLTQFDILVLSFGANEALALMSSKDWRQGLSDLLDDVTARAPAATKSFLLAIPLFSVNPHFPAALARVLDEHVERLNAATQQVLGSYPDVMFVPESKTQAYELENAHLYQNWSEAIAARISDNLDPARPDTRHTDQADEATRQQALEHLEALLVEDDGGLDALTNRARQLLGASIAAVTLIRSDTQVVTASTGTIPAVLPRDESFCDTTIRRSSHLVIEDASLDSRYADYSVVKGSPQVRFYAGYPLHSPDGKRIGALCVMDPQPRHFTDEEASALRTLALTVQDHLYRNDPT